MQFFPIFLHFETILILELEKAVQGLNCACNFHYFTPQFRQMNLFVMVCLKLWGSCTFASLRRVALFLLIWVSVFLPAHIIFLPFPNYPSQTFLSQWSRYEIMQIASDKLSLSLLGVASCTFTAVLFIGVCQPIFIQSSLREVYKWEKNYLLNLTNAWRKKINLG